MKIECPETGSIIELSECDCGPKCDHYYDTKQHRIDELETAMQEVLDWYLEYGVILKPQIDKLKQLLEK